MLLDEIERHTQDTPLGGAGVILYFFSLLTIEMHWKLSYHRNALQMKKKGIVSGQELMQEQGFIIYHVPIQCFHGGANVKVFKKDILENFQIMIDFNGMSTHLGLLYSRRVGNCYIVHIYSHFLSNWRVSFFFFF